MSTADIALTRQQARGQEGAFPWLALLPLALIPVFGTSAEGLQRILLTVRSQPRLLLEGETWNTLYEGVKLLVPFPALEVDGADDARPAGHPLDTQVFGARRHAFAGVSTPPPRGKGWLRCYRTRCRRGHSSQPPPEPKMCGETEDGRER